MIPQIVIRGGQIIPQVLIVSKQAGKISTLEIGANN